MDGNLIKYRPVAGVTPAAARIRETSRVLDDLVRPEHFARPPRLVSLGDPKDGAALLKIKDFLQGWELAAAAAGERRNVSLPEVEVQYFPSNPRATWWSKTPSCRFGKRYSSSSPASGGG